ncbi:permease [Kineococcus sp. SYSU DK005]|uniref:permease n=1 Tax=Kineococcus sp. SYSU DK005 TaxID=3383126 RepID=UPI003D7E8727
MPPTDPPGAAPAVPVPTRGPGRAAVAGVALFVLVAAGLLLWSKWLPYAGRVGELRSSHAWSGASVVASAGIEPGSGPSAAAGWAFTRVYFAAVWKALLAGVVIAAAVRTLVPRRWLLGLLQRRRSSSSAVVGGLLSTPSMMCTCCTAPVASALRRSGAPTAGVVAYWLGNPLLNPAVLVFLLLVAPWQWAAVRLLVGVLVVVAGSVLVARLAGERVEADAARVATAAADDPGPRGFPAALARTALLIVPEYLVVVFAVGTFSGWLFPLGESARSWGVLAVLVAVVLGTLLVVPTAGEVPLAQGLATAGFGGAVVGALLVVLPAVSLPSAVMTARALRVRVVLWTLAVVAAGGVLGAVLLPLLTGASS